MGSADLEVVQTVKRLGLFLALIAIALGIVIFRKKSGQRKSKLNVLIVSACSVRWDRIGADIPGFTGTPRIDAWAQGGFIFSNAIAEKPWQNLSFDLMPIVGREFLAREGYAVLGPPKDYTVYIPPVELKWHGKNWEWYWSEDGILHYQDSFAKLRSAILEKREQPFFVFTHLKYMHYPYLDSVNFTDSDLRALSPKSQKLLKKYRAHPERYKDRLPAIEAVLNSFGLLRNLFHVKTEIFSTAGIISDPTSNKIWQDSPGFADDLKLLKELYGLKLKKFDGIASEILNLFGDSDLAKKTVVIFTGDHGEAFMEHGVLGHSVNLYDEMLRYPLIIKFPGQDTTKKIEGQVNHRIVADIVKGIVTGNINAENISQTVQKLSEKTVVSRNCSDTSRAIREAGKWKFIKNFGMAKDELYNLQIDPLEKNNIADKFPEAAWRLEQQLMKQTEGLIIKSPSEIKARVCDPSRY